MMATQPALPTALGLLYMQFLSRSQAQKWEFNSLILGAQACKGYGFEPPQGEKLLNPKSSLFENALTTELLLRSGRGSSGLFCAKPIW